MNDILPAQSQHWQEVEKIFTQCASQYGYKEIRLPIVETTQLFKRTIGEVTDIVEKEMYTFTDLNGDSLTLRPEATAGCVRACLEHGLLHNQQQKLWYLGPMFRHEKPQKGRYRQFYQFGIEALGISGAGIELELIALCKKIWKELGIEEYVSLQINTLGELQERQEYKKQLIEYLRPYVEKLDADSRRRLEKNPLRILDSKNPETQALLQDAPKLNSFLSEASKKHFADLCTGLDKLNIAYTINPLLVRGLDYYGHTVFEWVTDKLGSQATICAGGRYDKLVEHLGGSPTPAVGFALGIERLLLLRETLDISRTRDSLPLIYMIADGENALLEALYISEKIRDKHNWQILVNTSGGSFKSQFKKADKSGATLALILGEEEVKQKTISIKNLRQSGEQINIPQDELFTTLYQYLQ